MSATATTIELSRKGDKPRLVRFMKSEIAIGFRAGCDLPLEPNAAEGGEVLLVVAPGKRPVLKPVRKADTMLLNGSACLAEAPVRAGDIISADGYRLSIRSLPATATEAPAEQVNGDHGENENRSDSSGDPLTRSQTATVFIEMPEPPRAEPAPAPAKKAAGLNYLYLFFAPVKDYLMDDDVSEVMINGPKQIFIERKGKLIATDAKFAGEQALQAAVMNVARTVGRFFDKDNPRLDARLPDGSRVHAVMPPIARAGTTIAIRKFRREKLTIEQLVKFGSISEEGARLLDVIVKLGRNIIVSGATSSGKTSVLNVLSVLIPDHDRILVLEDASELQLQQEHTVRFETRKADEYGKGEVTIRDLLHSALRLRPDRIVVGEIRGGEALDLLQAMNTGHEGSMSTIHANSARDSLLRLETCALFSGVEIPLSALREQVASAIQIVIQTARLHDGTRKITAITEILGLKDREYQFQDILVFRPDGVAEDGKITGRHVLTGYRPTFADVAEQRGLKLPS
jgi:pilus assembly protein CpaF